MQKGSIRPIHKFNGGNEATLCYNCGKMIWLGLVDELYCEDCGIKIMEKVWSDEDDENESNLTKEL